jgi:hypothetical protein
MCQNVRGTGQPGRYFRALVGTGDCVIGEVLTGRVRGQLVRSVSKRRSVRLVIEVGYDAAAWIGGLLLAARATSDVDATHLTRFVLWGGAAGICAVVAGCGLVAGLYRGRHLRGSRDEVTAVAVAGFLTACGLAVSGLALVTGQRALAATVLGGAAVAVVAMLAARYVVSAARVRSRPPAATATKIIVFGAGGAGAQLIHRLSTQPSTTTPRRGGCGSTACRYSAAATRWPRPPPAPVLGCWSSR